MHQPSTERPEHWNPLAPAEDYVPLAGASIGFGILLGTALSGASWVSFHHGGGVGMGYSLHAGQVTVADGTARMADRIERVLTNDPGIGVARHADAGYEIAIEAAKRHGIKMPMLK